MTEDELVSCGLVGENDAYTELGRRYVWNENSGTALITDLRAEIEALKNGNEELAWELSVLQDTPSEREDYISRLENKLQGMENI
jgi:hypothetical protein